MAGTVGHGVRVLRGGAAALTFEGVLRLLPQAVYRADLGGRLLAANPAFLHILGLDPSGPVPDLDLSTTLRDEPGGFAPAAARAADPAAAGGARRRGLLWLVRPDGSRRRVAVLESLGCDERGEPCVEGLLEEDPPGSEEASRRFQSMGRLAGAVAHDVNNLLTAIGGYASLLAAGLPPGDERRRDADGILSATERCRILVAQLLDAGRQPEGRMDRVDLRSVAAGLWGLLERLVGGRGRLRRAFAEAPLPVRADPALLEQILLNLVANARDALRQDGEIRVLLREDRLDAPRGALPAGPCVVLEVSDDGAGMAPVVAERAFEPFFTTKAPGLGTGLGLTTVRAAVGRLGGEVGLASRPGQGTRVEVWLARAGDS